MALLRQIEVAHKLGYEITQFKTVIKHQPNFPKPIKAHPKAHPKWRDSDIDMYLERLAA